MLFRSEAIADIGENTSIRRFVVYEVEGNGAVASYIHMGGKIGVFVDLATDDDSVITKPEFADFAKDIAMQIAAANPKWLTREDVPAAEIEKETEIIINKNLNEGKPEKIIRERILPGTDITMENHNAGKADDHDAAQRDESQQEDTE